MTDSQLSVSLSTLLCQEAEECFDEDSFTNLKHCATTSQTDDDFVQVLLHREVSARKKSPSTSFAVNPSWIKSARPEAIAWFLISQESWVIPLLSVACLSLAAKMEECGVPSLLEFQLEEYEFKSNVIQRMELLFEYIGLEIRFYHSFCLHPTLYGCILQ